MLFLLFFASLRLCGWSHAFELRSVSPLHKLTARAPGQLDALPDEPTPHLLAARGEWESFQLVITAGETELRAPQVKSSALRSAHNAIPAENVRLYRQNYAFVSQPSGNRELAPKWWPDALVPLEVAPLPDVPAKRSLALWVCVRVPRGATPGHYRSEIEVSSDGQRKIMPFSVFVFENAQLPAPTFRANVALYYDGLREWYQRANITFSNAEWQTQRERYAEFLLDFRLNPYDPPHAWNSPRIDRYLRDPRVTSVRVPPLGSREFPLALRALERTKTFNKAYSYQIDEPPPERFAETRDFAKQLRVQAPRVKFLLTAHPAKGLPDADIWCPNIGDFFGVGSLDFQQLARERGRGRETWLYTMVEPRAPYPTWLIDDDAASVRIYGALWARWNTNGFVYSMAHGWGPEPLSTPRTFADTWGDGLLLYPSELVGGGTSAASSGPMPSVRLMLLRDALEDYELLQLAARARRESLAKLVFAVLPAATGAPDASDALRFETSPEVWRAFRLQLLDALDTGNQWTSEPSPFDSTTSASVELPRPTFALDSGPGTLSRVSRAPQIDGRLNDAAWNALSRFTGTLFRFKNDAYTPPRTLFWAARDGSHLFVAMKCFGARGSEWAAVELAPQNASERFRFVVTRRGTQVLERHTREGRFKIDGANWNGAHHDASSVWTAEFRVPLSLVNGASAPFRFNILRRTQTVHNTRVLLRAHPDAGNVTLMPLVR